MFGILLAVAILFAITYFAFALIMEVVYAQWARRIEKDVQYQLTAVQYRPRHMI